MDSKNLISKFNSIFFNHFFNSPLLEHSSVHCDSIQAFKCKSQYACLSIFNSSLTISMVFEVFLKFCLVFKVIHLSFFMQKTFSVSFWLINPLDSRVNQFIRIMVNIIWLKIGLLSCFNMFIIQFLPSWVVFWLFNVLIREVIVFELNFLNMSYLCVARILLFFDI